MALRVDRAGWATSLQDRGRVGYASIGVTRSGFLDRRAAELVNRLVGNDADTVVVESRGGCVLVADAPTVVATSAEGARRLLGPGDRVRIEAPADGMWGYLAVRGGFDVDLVLGSAATDSLSGIGPPPLADGDMLATGPDPRTAMPAELAPPRARTTTLRVWAGPRESVLRGEFEAFVSQRWEVTNEVSRVGARLSGARLRRPADSGATMPSEGLVRGAVQITPSDTPIVMLADHPTTGGYPVVAVVDADDVGHLAQAPPGSTLRFVAQ